MSHYALAMADGQQADELAAKAAETVRRVIAEAEARAAEIVREANEEAARIRDGAESDASRAREQAEADARAQIEAARRALDELGGSLAAAVSSATPGGEPLAAQEAEPMSPEVPEPPVSPPATEPEPPAPEDAASTPDDGGGDAAERLVAMKLAVEGKDPAAIEAELIERFGPGDRADLLHEVLGRISR